jgi:hypothetical protein
MAHKINVTPGLNALKGKNMPLYNYEVDGNHIDSFHSAATLTPRDTLVLIKRFCEARGIISRGVRITGGRTSAGTFEPGFH